MKFKIDRKMALPALTAAKSCAGTRSGTLPILQYALFNAQEQVITVSATDLQGYLQMTVPGEVIEPGIALLKIDQLLALVTLASEDSILLTVDDAKCTVQSGRSKNRLGIYQDLKDFPKITPPEGSPVVIQCETFHRAINIVRHSCATNDVRFYLNALNIVVSGGEMMMQSSDGHRGTRCMAGKLAAGAPDFDILLSIASHKAVTSLLPAEGPVLLVTNGNIAEFEIAGRMTYRTRLIEGRFPDLNRLLLPETEKWVELDVHELAGALDRARIMLKDVSSGALGTSQGAAFSLRDGEFRITRQDNEFDIDESVPTLSGAKHWTGQFGLSIAYLRDTVGALMSDGVNTIRFDHNDEKADDPKFLRWDDTKSCAVIMPMRL